MALDCRPVPLCNALSHMTRVLAFLSLGAVTGLLFVLGLFPQPSSAAAPPLDWSVTASPNPGVSYNVLEATSCVKPRSCMAVGYADSGSGAIQTLAEVWNGSDWSVIPTPSPGSFYNQLDGVTCTSVVNCIAVGYYADVSTGASFPLVETFNGTGWSTVSAPGNGALNAVACISATNCVAVGYDNSNNTLVESFDGSAWSVGVSPNPGVVENQLKDVTCTAATNCVAVGITDNGGSTLVQTLVESFNGMAWSVEASPDISPQHNDVLKFNQLHQLESLCRGGERRRGHVSHVVGRRDVVDRVEPESV